MTCTRWSTSPFFHSCARQEVDTALRVCSGQIDGANNLSRTLEHARSNAAAELPQWRNQLERTACELAGGPSDHSSTISHCGATNWSVRHARQIHGTDPLLRWRVSLNRSTPSAGCSSQKTIPRPSRESCIVARTVAYGCTQTSLI